MKQTIIALAVLSAVATLHTAAYAQTLPQATTGTTNNAAATHNQVGSGQEANVTTNYGQVNDNSQSRDGSTTQQFTMDNQAHINRYLNGNHNSNSNNSIQHERNNNANGGASNANGGQGGAATNNINVTTTAPAGAPAQAAPTNVTNTTHNSTANNVHHRYVNVQPVRIDGAITVVPSAQINRMVSQECGPQMIVRAEKIMALNNRPLGSEMVHNGYTEWLVPNEEEPYRVVEVVPGYKQMFGHRVVDSVAVVTNSTAGGIGFGLNFSSGAGGNGSTTASGSLQTLSNQIQLVPCLAFEVDTRELKPRG